METQRDKDIAEFEKAKKKLVHELAKAFKLYEILDWLLPKAEWINKKIVKIRGRH